MSARRDLACNAMTDRLDGHLHDATGRFPAFCLTHMRSRLRRFGERSTTAVESQKEITR